MINFIHIHTHDDDDNEKKLKNKKIIKKEMIHLCRLYYTYTHTHTLLTHKENIIWILLKLKKKMKNSYHTIEFHYLGKKYEN